MRTRGDTILKSLPKCVSTLDNRWNTERTVGVSQKKSGGANQSTPEPPAHIRIGPPFLVFLSSGKISKPPLGRPSCIISPQTPYDMQALLPAPRIQKENSKTALATCKEVRGETGQFSERSRPFPSYPDNNLGLRSPFLHVLNFSAMDCTACSAARVLLSGESPCGGYSFDGRNYPRVSTRVGGLFFFGGSHVEDATA